jgi:hypothetical protein
MGKKSSTADSRTFHVMRFSESDKKIMSEHLAQFRSWAEGLDALIPVVEAMAKEPSKPKAPRDKPMRIGLDKDFIKAAKKLKKPMTETIIAAAKRYADQHGKVKK